MSEAARHRRRRAKRWRNLAVAAGSLAASLLVGFVLWEIAVVFFEIPTYVLPSPRAVMVALADGLAQSPTSRAGFWYHLWDTMQATLAGFVIGSVLGLVLAAAMAEFRPVERLLFPYIAAIQSLPKVAIAPLYVIWFGYQIESKIAMAATLVLFPVLLNALQGFLSVERDRLELMASLDASRWQIFWLVKLPASLPLIFAGLNLGIVYGLLGALVAEFIGAQRGMGVMVMQLQSVNDTAGVFAVLMVLALVGYVLIAAMRLIQYRVVFWSADSARNNAA
jgi:NitT/TauT family transport system permease protein